MLSGSFVFEWGRCRSGGWEVYIPPIAKCAMDGAPGNADSAGDKQKTKNSKSEDKKQRQIRRSFPIRLRSGSGRRLKTGDGLYTSWMRFHVVSLALALASTLSLNAQSGVQKISVSFPAARSATPLDGRVLLLLSNDVSEEPRM
jgi:hypothetical protein